MSTAFLIPLKNTPQTFEISLAGVSSLAEAGEWIELGGVRLRAAALD